MNPVPTPLRENYTLSIQPGWNGVNVLELPKGQRPKATDVSPWYGVYVFKLLRYFSITSLVAIGIVAALLGTFYRRIAVGNLLEHGESNNVALTQSLANDLWVDFAPFVTSVSDRKSTRLNSSHS